MGAQSIRVGMAVCAFIVMTACEQPAGPSAAVPDLAGEWTGTIHHSVAGDGAVTLSVSQRGPGLTGSWSSVYPDAAFNQQGSFSATLTGTPFLMFLRPTVPIACSPNLTLTGTMAVTATLTDGRLSGPFTILNCAGVLTGRIEVGRR